MERWTGNLELNAELHLPAENRFIGGLIVLRFVPRRCRKNAIPLPQTDARL